MPPKYKRLINSDYHAKVDVKLDLMDIPHSALVCRALSSETRLQILYTLIERSMTISQLAEYFYLPISSMSGHIHILEEAGLVTAISNPGVRGTKKVCGISASSVTLDFFAHKKKMPLQKASVFYPPYFHSYSLRIPGYYILYLQRILRRIFHFPHSCLPFQISDHPL